MQYLPCPVAPPSSPFRSVIFDCDSTLTSIEGIEELASDHRAEVTALTEAAMRGEVPLEDVYARRLELARPSRDQVAGLGRRYVESLVPDAREVVAALIAHDIDVRIISGGILSAVVALARELGLHDGAVAAVELYFDADGRYAGYDTGSPLARTSGKRLVIQEWVPPVPRPAMLVGDGATDLEARPAVECFVAYTGVIAHAAVVAGADVVIRTQSLAPVLPLAVGSDAAPRPGFRELHERGRALLGSEPRGRAAPSRDTGDS